MPEANRRRIVKGLREAAKRFQEYVATRVQAETDAGKLDRELRELKKQVEKGKLTQEWF